MTPESALRLVTRHKVSLANVMPVAYTNRIRRIPGVEEVNANQWFGGIYQDPANFFANFAVDHETFFTVYPDIETSPAEREAFESERMASLVGVNLAERFGWKIGDRVTLEGTFTPFDVETIVSSFVSGANSENTFYFRGDYFDELFGRAGIAGTFTIRAESAELIPAVIESIDAEFTNTNAPTKTESEKSFILGFMEMWGNIRALIVSISTVVLFTIILVAANTMAMSIRERTGEIAILKTLGFNRRQVLELILVESVHNRAGRRAAGLARGAVSLRFDRLQSDDDGFHPPVRRALGHRCPGCSYRPLGSGDQHCGAGLQRIAPVCR